MAGLSVRRLIGVLAPFAVALFVLGGAPVAWASIPSTAIRYVYDADGQLKAVVSPASETALYSWDSAGNLVSIGLKSSTKLSVLQLTPAQGEAGETVTIAGTGFSTKTKNDTVKFNGTAATVSAATEWALTVKVPSGATTGTVSVQTTTEGPVTSAQTFTVASSRAPHVSSLSTNLAAVGSTVTASGSNFETSVFNDVTAVNQTRAELTSETSTALKLTVPAATGSGHVVVGTPQGSSTGPVLYIPPTGYSVSQVGATGEVSVGGSTTVSLPTAEKIGLEVFEGTAGESVSVVASEVKIARGGFAIWGPEGTKLTSGTELFREGESSIYGPVTLPRTGTYTILVQPDAGDTGTVKVSTYSVVNQTGSLTPSEAGAPVAVSLATPGQEGRFSIAGTAGKTIGLSTSSASFTGGWRLEWVNPEGHVVASQAAGASSNAVLHRLTFATTGTYTAVVKPEGVATGSTTLTAVADVVEPLTPTEAGESKTIKLGVPGQNGELTFSGTKGESVSVVASEVKIARGGVAIWGPEGKLPGGEEVFREGESSIYGPVTLPATGSYTIWLEPEIFDTGTLKVSAYKVVNQTGSLTPTEAGASIAVSLSTPGQEGRFEVSGTAGKTIGLSTSSASFTGGWRLEWLNPEGHVVASQSEGASSNGVLHRLTFATTGTYTAVVKLEGAATGSATLTAVADVVEAISPTEAGESKTIKLGVAGQDGELTFSGSEGASVTVTTSEVKIARGGFAVWGPEGKLPGGETVFREGESSVYGPVTLPKTGGYTIWLEPELFDTGTLKVTAVDPPGHEALRRPGSHASTARGITHRGRVVSKPQIAPAPVARPEATTPHTVVPVTRAMRLFRPRRATNSAPPAHGAADRTSEGGEPMTPWAKIAQLQAPYGATAVSGQVLAQNGLPLAGVEVSIEGTKIAARTDEAGRFLLSGAPAGEHALIVEGETASGKQRYGSYEVGINIPAHRTLILPYTIWLTPLDPAGDHKIASPTGGETRLTTPQIPGFEVRLPAGTVIKDASGHVVHRLNITAIPVDRTPFPLPPFVEVPVYFTVQPGRAYLSKGAQIVYPNSAHLPAGEKVAFWNYSPDVRRWYVYGHGTVTPDGKQIMPDPNVRVWEFTGAMITSHPTPPGKEPSPGRAPAPATPSTSAPACSPTTRPTSCSRARSRS